MKLLTEVKFKPPQNTQDEELVGTVIDIDFDNLKVVTDEGDILWIEKD